MSTVRETELMVMPAGRELANRDGEWSVAQIIDQKRKVVEIMNAVMKPDEHYGVIPGAKKPSLWKPGAETLCLTFRLDPEYEVMKATEEPTLISFTVRCVLNHINTGNRIASGLGSCNSREEKYKRQAQKVCPKCSKQTIFKSKNEGEGWFCWKKKDGCGATFKDGDKAIEGQSSGIADPADLHNTILKMACKRALIAAVLNGTAASDCFTQDLEDLPPQFQEERAPNVPVPSKAGKGSWPAHVPTTSAAEDANAAMDAEYRAAMRGEVPMSPEDYETPYARLIDDATVEVRDRVTDETTKQPRPSKAMMTKLQTLRRELMIKEEAWKAGLKKYYSIDTSTLLSKAQCADVIDRLEKTKEKAAQALASVNSAVANLKTVFPGATPVDEDEQNRQAAAPGPEEGPQDMPGL